ncbi:hypothetical protein E6O75_ATG10850 [Venturia nashicola]|uniref:Uncharacterized protein n=1 Tax=Venturia nashicola TaxID=86259 RepID=A0A4Z1PAJ9_9PEZI|nr:hypothetical protein E6O75_ATG10850 [Venturia nashicola]
MDFPRLGFLTILTILANYWEDSRPWVLSRDYVYTVSALRKRRYRGSGRDHRGAKTATVLNVPIELLTDKGDVELEVKHGDNEMFGQGRPVGLSRHLSCFEMRWMSKQKKKERKIMW